MSLERKEMSSNEDVCEPASSPTDWGEIMDRVFEAEENQQTEPHTPYQDLENVSNSWTEKRPPLRQPRSSVKEEVHPSVLQTTTAPAQARRPQDKELLELKCLLQQEKRKRVAAENARDISLVQLKEREDQLQEETKKRLQLEKKVASLQETARKFADQLLKDLRLAKNLQADKKALRLEKEMDKKKNEESQKELVDLKRQLEHKNTSNLELASELKACQLANEELRKTLELLTQQMCEQTPESGAPEVETETPELIQEPLDYCQETTDTNIRWDNDTTDNVQETPARKVSLWRRLKKALTPKHRRKYKDRRQGQVQD